MSQHSDPILLRISGKVRSPREFSYQQFCDFPSEWQVPDVAKLVPQRPGGAVRLFALLEAVQPLAAADYLGLHSSQDDFHASIPLQSVREQALLIYCLDGAPLPPDEGGPIRFFIPDHAACHSDEIDECANVKFIDHIEFTQGKGYDNRPVDDQQHARLHEQQ